MIRAAIRSVAAIALLVAIFGCTTGLEGDRGNIPLSQAATTKLARMGSSPGAPMLMRIYKRDSQLEVWKKTTAGSYELFDIYEICAWSGDLGPKISEGDRQTPEGFYTITPGLLNPRSQYHLAINLGFPNQFDRSLGRDGSNIMVHGDCSSRGCYAMTNEQIEEIYALARETFAGGNRSFQAQVFPFRMTAENFAEFEDDPNLAFWRNLKLGHDITEVTGEPPVWDVCGPEYAFNTESGCGPSTMSDGSRLRLASLQQADASALTAAIAARAEAERLAVEAEALRIADAASAEQRRLELEAAAAERREAVASFTGQIGAFFSGFFGGGSGSPPVDDPTAPVPPPRPARYS